MQNMEYKGFSQIEGMFASAIYDGESLLIVRDAIGKKTLFYTQTKDTFIASSSLKSLLKFPHIEKNLNLHAVASFLTFAYLPGAETLIKNIFELFPAHALRIFPDGKTELINYYEPVEQIDETSFDRPTGSKIFVRHLKIRSLHRLPKTDEEIGVFLSGGIDSSLVAALASKFRPEQSSHIFNQFRQGKSR